MLTHELLLERIWGERGGGRRPQRTMAGERGGGRRPQRTMAGKPGDAADNPTCIFTEPASAFGCPAAGDGTIEEAMTMNAPHIKAIHYFIEHDDSVDYRNVAPLVFEDDLFRVKAEKVEVTFEPKNHYATEEEARSAVEGLVRRWEFEAALRVGSRSFKLTYARVTVVDRDPPPLPPGVVRVDPVAFHFRVSQPQVRVTKMLAEYPVLPSVQTLKPDDPNASVMLSRLDLYRQGRDPLGDVANFCLTVLEYSALQLAGGKGNKRKAAANHYRIAVTILNRVATLSSKKGGPVARKAEGRDDAFTPGEARFLEAAVTAFVRRAAENAADPNGNLPFITMADLPDPST